MLTWEVFILNISFIMAAMSYQELMPSRGTALDFALSWAATAIAACGFVLVRVVVRKAAKIAASNKV